MKTPLIPIKNFFNDPNREAREFKDKVFFAVLVVALGAYLINLSFELIPIVLIGGILLLFLSTYDSRYVLWRVWRFLVPTRGQVIRIEKAHTLSNSRDQIVSHITLQKSNGKCAVIYTNRRTSKFAISVGMNIRRVFPGKYVQL